MIMEWVHAFEEEDIIMTMSIFAVSMSYIIIDKAKTMKEDLQCLSFEH
jgi:hypothetical protein